MELQRERDQTCFLEQRVELMLSQAEKPPHVVQIQKWIVGTDHGEWDRDICGDSEENSINKMEELEQKDVRPLIKREARGSAG